MTLSDTFERWWWWWFVRGVEERVKKGGSWKWPSHVGNKSALRSERTHKRPHYLGAAPLGPRRHRALTFVAAVLV